MQSSKEMFLFMLGLEDKGYDNSLLLSHDLKLKRKNEPEPFGELFTKDGRVTLRVGAAYEDGITVIL